MELRANQSHVRNHAVARGPYDLLAGASEGGVGEITTVNASATAC
jgi:hypothetical protein